MSRLLQSFRCAVRGAAYVWRSQPNARFHAAATLGVVGLGLYFGLNSVEWAAVVLAIAAVWSAEAFNTAVERLGDAVSTEHHPRIGEAKDTAAGAVLLAAIGAAVVGVVVFGRRLLELLS